MKKFYLTLSLCIFLFFSAEAQTFWFDDFDDYTAGDYVGSQSNDWSTWSGSGAGTAEDIFVVNSQSNSGSNSLECIGGGSADIILPLNNLNEGEYTVELAVRVEPGNGGYYNFQEDNTPAVGWAFECYFSNDGSWEMIMDQAQVASGTYTPGEWFRMAHVVDLVSNTIAVYQDDAPAGSFAYDSPIGSINIFPAAPAGQTAQYYIDDIFVYKSKESFDDYVAGESLGNVSQQWSTWSGSGAGSAEDGSVSNAFAYDGTNSGHFMGAACDAIYPLGNFDSGSWEYSMKIYTAAGNGGYMNIQHDQVPGISWANEWTFGGNEGSLNAGTVGAASFTWSDDTWHDVTFIIDCDNDMAEMFVDGSSIHSWPFSDEANSQGSGVPVLGGVDFFPAGAPTGLSPDFYIDNMTFRRSALLTSIDDIESPFNKLTLFPNPTNAIAFVRNDFHSDLESEMRIYNGMGQLVDQRFEVFNVGEIIEINTSAWTPGIYFIEFIADEKRNALKLIKE
ncbi:MAG: T9SS type A sorting domain-containing protein [Bacteroidota bacterium]